MRKTNNNTMNENSLCISRQKLAEILNVGLATADRISREAEARIVVGRRILICVKKINDYLETASE